MIGLKVISQPPSHLPNREPLQDQIVFKAKIRKFQVREKGQASLWSYYRFTGHEAGIFSIGVSFNFQNNYGVSFSFSKRKKVAI